MKKLIVSLVLSVFLLSLVLGSAVSCSSTETPSEPVVLKISTTLPPPQAEKLQDMADSFNQRAAGTNYSIEVYPGGALATMEEAMDMVQSGAVDMAEIGLSAAMTHDLRFGAGTGIPFLIDDIDANAKYAEIIVEEMFADIMEESFNQKILTAWLSPPLYWCGIKPVKTLEDWDGLLVHTMSSLQSDAVEALGASSVSMPFFDVVPAMEKGVLDGGVNLNTYVINMMNWFDAFKYITVADMFCGMICFTINLDAFNAMPDDVRDILVEEAELAGQALEDFSVSNVEMTEQACIDHGIEIYYLPDTERARWEEATRSVVDDFFAQLDPDDVEIILEAAEEANS